MSSLSIENVLQKVEKILGSMIIFIATVLVYLCTKKCESDLPLYKRLKERVPRIFFKLNLPPILLTLRFEVMVYKFGPTLYKKDLDDLSNICLRMISLWPTTWRSYSFCILIETPSHS